MNVVTPGEAMSACIVDELARSGLRHAVLAPGSRSAPLALALAEDDRVELHVAIDERSAAFAALGIAKTTNNPAAVLSTSGTAAANFVPAVIEADLSRVPLIVLTADRPPELRDTGANQTIDQVRLFGVAVRWFCDTGAPEATQPAVSYWRSLACRAWAEATGSPAGPVHVNLPFRKPLVGRPGDAPLDLDLSGRAEEIPWTRVSRAIRPPAVRDVFELSALLDETPNGVLVVGDTEADPGSLLALAERVGWPVLAEPLSGSRMGRGAISTYEALLRDDEWAADHVPDAVVRIGKVALSKRLLALCEAAPIEMLIDRDGAWLDPLRSTVRIVAADPALTCREVTHRVVERPTSRWLDEWIFGEDVVRAAIDRALDEQEALTEPRAARDVAAFVPDGSTLVVGSSMPVRDLDWFMRPRSGLRCIANRGASGIDGFVSTVLGAAAAARKQTWALCGDLSLVHDQNGFASSLARRVDAVFVVLNNDGGGIFSFLPQAGLPNFEQVFATPHGLDLSKLAAVYGAEHVRVESGEALDSTLRRVHGEPGIKIVEVPTDRAANVEVHRELWAAAAAALGKRS